MSASGGSGSDYVPDRGPSVFVVTTATLILASIFVAARLVTRIWIVRNLSWDDYFMALAWCLAFGLSLAIDLGTKNGLGRHDEDIVFADWNTLRRCEYVFSVLYNPALMATKTSILIFYLRLSRNTQQVLRLASWMVLVVVNVAGIVLTLLNVFQCRPIQAGFNRFVAESQCIPLLTEFICSAPINIVTDLAILALPIPVLTGMRIPHRQKVILVFTFALGIFITIVDVVRIYYLQQAITAVTPTASSDPQATFGDSVEFSWNASLSLMWSAVEVNVGMTCACIPTLKPLFVRILPAMIIDPDGTLRRGEETEKQPSDSSRISQQNRSSVLTAVPEGGVIQPRAAAVSRSNVDQQISAMEFLTTPDMAPPDISGSVNPASPTSMTRTSVTLTSGTDGGNSVYFGFVNMKRPKSMIRTSVRDSFKYCTVVTVLFVLWGFSYGLLNTLNNVIAAIADMSVPQTLGLTSMYFGAGYFFGPLVVGEWILRHDEHRRIKKHDGTPTIGGFKATFMVGLCIYGIGTIMYWPSAVLSSFAGFMISNFVVGFGLAVLETAANPFLVLCGPMDYAEMRLLLAQGVQAVAAVVSGVLAQKVFFTEISSDGLGNVNSLSLLDVQWTYLAITLFCVALALFFYYMPLPEVTDAECENSTRWLPVNPRKRSIGGIELRTWTLALAVLAQWCYVAGQEIMSIFFRGLLSPLGTMNIATNPSSSLSVLQTAQETEDHPPGLTLSIPDFLLLGHTAFALSRFLTAYLAYLSPTHPKVPQPRTILTICTMLTIVFSILVAALRPNNHNLLAIPMILFFFSEGPMWPLIFCLGLRAQGKRTKRAAAWITMGACGPAFWPFVIYGINQAGANYQVAFVVVPALLVVMAVFSLFLDMTRDARALVDARVGAEEQSRIVASSGHEDLDLDRIILRRRRTGSVASEITPGLVKRLSSSLEKGLGHMRKKSETPTAEHREDRRPSAT